MYVKIVNFKVSTEYLEPTIEMNSSIEDIPGTQVIYRTTATLKINNKILDTSTALICQIQELVPVQNPSPDQTSSISLKFDFNISKRTLKEIDSHRNAKANMKREVEFEVTFNILMIEAQVGVSRIRKINKNTVKLRSLPVINEGLHQLDKTFKRELGEISALYNIDSNNYKKDSKDMDMLYAGANLNNSRNIMALKTVVFNKNHIIDSQTWILEFAPNLEAGECEIVELPKIKLEAKGNRYKNALDLLGTSKENLYKLNNAVALSTLRDSIDKFNIELKRGKYIKEYEEKEKKGKYNYSPLFDDNNKVKSLAENLQRKINDVCSRSEEAGVAHQDTDYQIEGYEIESMISMTYSLYKMVFQKITQFQDSKRREVDL